jgi:hypothetical protein
MVTIRLYSILIDLDTAYIGTVTTVPPNPLTTTFYSGISRPLTTITLKTPSKTKTLHATGMLIYNHASSVTSQSSSFVNQKRPPRIGH